MNNTKLKISAIEGKSLKADIAITIEDMFGWAVIGDNGDVKTCTNSRIKLYEKGGIVSALHRVEHELENMIRMAETLGTVCLRSLAPAVR